MKQCTISLLMLFVGSLMAQDVSSIILKTEANYSSLKVYLDSGKVISSFYNNARPHKSALIFKTAYKNTGVFNFEFYPLGSDRLHIVNRDENNKVMVLDGFTVKSGSTFSLAMAGGTGISSGSAIMIPNLLMPDAIKTKARNLFHRISDIKLEPSEVINGSPCYKLTGKENVMDKDGYLMIWISKKDYLIRKIETDRKINDFRVRTTFLYTPYSLKADNKALFKFQPNRKVEL